MPALIRTVGAAVACCVVGVSTSIARAPNAASVDVYDRVSHGYATSGGGVKIHYATLGAGPLVIMIHGFPDFWYSWRHQMAALSDRFQVVAIDQRGYDLSDKPKGVESYAMRLLVADVASVIRHLGRDKATIVGHDWGGAVAWNFAMTRPEMTENLVVLSEPHPKAYARELKVSTDLAARAEYWHTFVQKTARDPTVYFGLPMTPETLARRVKDPAVHARYVDAFMRSDFDAMLNYYKMYAVETNFGTVIREGPKIQAPVLVLHGLADTTVTPNTMSGMWEWVERDLTLITIPGAGHFVQQDAAEFVTSTLRSWLTMRSAKP